MTSFLVIRPCKRFPNCTDAVIIDGADTVLEHPFESWCMDRGRVALVAHFGLYRRLKKLHMFGITYALPYDQMVGIVEEIAGPSDRAIYQELKSVADLKTPRRWTAALTIALRTASIGIYIMWCVVKLLAVVLIIPFIIGALRNHGKR